MYVHNKIGNSSDGKIPVHLDISVYGTKCESNRFYQKLVWFKNIYLTGSISIVLGIDIQDDLGRHEVGHVEDEFKVPMNNGKGCRMKVKFKINRVPGNFHVSTHAAAAQPTESDMRYIFEVNFIIKLLKSKLFDWLVILYTLWCLVIT